jgi:hypothetical protein
MFSENHYIKGGEITARIIVICLGRVNKLSSIFGWLWLRLAASVKFGLPASRPAFYLLASLVLAQPKSKPNLFTNPYMKGSSQARV